MLRRCSAVLLALGLLVVLSGCLRVEMDMEISEDETISGSMITAVHEEALVAIGSFGGSGSTDPRVIWDELQEDAELPDGATVEPYEVGDYIGDRTTFTDVPLSEMEATMQQEDGLFSVDHDGDTYVFEASFNLSDSGESGALLDNPQADAFFTLYGKPEMLVSMTFPGEILETNGEVDGTTVTWSRDLTEANAEPMRATSRDSGGAVRGSGAEGTGHSGSGPDSIEAKGSQDSTALVATGVGAGGLVLVLALLGMGIGVTRALRG